MCGLIGIAGDVNGNWKDVFTDLLIFDSVRGLHSTGAGLVRRFTPNEGDFNLIKRPGHPFNLLETEEYQKAMGTNVSVKAMLGHNRHATFGEKTEENAHPFAFEHVMGMHNGTLDKFSVKDLHDYEKYGTDSEAIFATINEFGIEETVKRLSGAWALVWYDRRNNTLNFLRNDKRPLHYCYSADRCTIIWSSEYDMLEFAMKRRHRKMEDDKIYPVPVDTHFSWTIPPSITKKFDLPTQVEMKGKKTWSYTDYKGPFKAATGGKNSMTTTEMMSLGLTTTQTSSSHTSSSKPSRKTAEVIDFSKRLNVRKFRPPYKDMYGRVITKKEFGPMVAEGCAFCNRNDITWGEFVHVMGGYYGYHTPFMCNSCYDSEETFEFSKYAV